MAMTIGAEGRIDHVEVLMLEERGDLVAEPLELLFVQLLVDGSPPDAILRPGLADEKLVLRRTPGVPPGVDDERAAFCE